jgi:hypothetical protein
MNEQWHKSESARNDIDTHTRAREMTVLPDVWNSTPVERRLIIWKSPDGVKLRDLYSASMKRRKIQKTGEHAEAFRIMKSWTDDPADGLR